MAFVGVENFANSKKHSHSSLCEVFSSLPDATRSSRDLFPSVHKPKPQHVAIFKIIFLHHGRGLF